MSDALLTFLACVVVGLCVSLGFAAGCAVPPMSSSGLWEESR